MSDVKQTYLLGIDQVRAYLPHRQPFLMIDRVLEIQHHGPEASLSPKDLVGTKVVALKSIAYNEPIFAGHFPGFSIFPGVLIVEAMAQTSCFTVYPALSKDSERLKRFKCIFVGIDDCRFRRPVTPGDSLKITTVVTGGKGTLWTFDCEAHVDGQVVAQAKIVAQLAFHDQN